MSLIDRLNKKHQPNTPRTHDGQGHKIEEAVQCQECLQKYPCETRQLLDMISAKDEVIQSKNWTIEQMTKETLP